MEKTEGNEVTSVDGNIVAEVETSKEELPHIELGDLKLRPSSFKALTESLEKLGSLPSPVTAPTLTVLILFQLVNYF